MVCTSPGLTYLGPWGQARIPWASLTEYREPDFGANSSFIIGRHTGHITEVPTIHKKGHKKVTVQSTGLMARYTSGVRNDSFPIFQAH